MCIVGLYFVFLLLQSLIVGYYSDSGNSTLTQNENLNFDALYNFFNIDPTNTPTKHIAKRSISKKQYPNIEVAVPSKKPGAQRITNKQYEIIDTIWKKNKNVVIKSATPTGQKININHKSLSQKKRTTIKPLTFSIPTTTTYVTTSSKIEFYYLDDTPFVDNNGKPRQAFQWQNVEVMGTTNVPFLIFHFRGPYNNNIQPTNFNNSNVQLQNKSLKISTEQLNESLNNLEQKKQRESIPVLGEEQKIIPKKKPKKQRQYLKEYFFDGNSSLKGTTKTLLSMISLNSTSSVPSSENTIAESTTTYDKIKFFEIYDQFTPEMNDKFKINHSKVKHNETNLIDKNQKTLLENLNNDKDSHDHIQAKHAKKHITEIFEQANLPMNDASLSKFVIKTTHKKRANGTSYFINGAPKSEHNNQTYLVYTNETARWSDYPFTAVYIYEPSQVHCDAAAINTHWLIASGSCLSRVKKPQESFEAYGEGRSAFVAYCGDRWWTPERVAYVKYTVVHPSYHHKDKLRQHLYNIGVIQVESSLKSACTGWAPVSLMSHHAVARPGGNQASALGWGLDRFDTRYLSTDLPKVPLMVYKSIVYFDSCPGNNGYRKTKELDGGGGVRNVHCLALPPYYGEATDPVHGGLLLADGKLIALYLQEERRAFGEQSAQYTGVWRLIPWLMDVAQEPEELDTVIFDIL